MRDLPAGWAWATLGEIADVVGGVQKSPERMPAANAYPMLRAGNVLAGGLDLEDVHTIELFDGEVDRLRLEVGDCLIVEGSGSVSRVGRAGMWRGEIPDCVHQNHVIRARPRIHPPYLTYWMLSPSARDQIERVASSTSGLNVLSGRKVKALEVPVPPLHEQERIVAALEAGVAGLAGASASLRSSGTKLDALRSAAIADVLVDGPWPTTRWADIGQTLSGKAFPSGEYADQGVHLLRPGNLQRTGDVAWTQKSTKCLPLRFADQSPKYLLEGVHLLMNLTAQSLADDFLGRVCLSATDDRFLLNQRIASLRSSEASDQYLFWVFRSRLFRTFVASLNTGSLIQHISTRHLGSFTFPLPPPEDQARLVEKIGNRVAAIDRLVADLGSCERRVPALRRSILAAAFSGQLVPQDPGDEPASALLDQIRLERTEAGAR